MCEILYKNTAVCLLNRLLFKYTQCCNYFCPCPISRAIFWPVSGLKRWFWRAPPPSFSRFYFHKMTSNLPNHDKGELVSPPPPLPLSIHLFIPPPLLCALMDAGVLICSQTQRWTVSNNLVNVELVTKTMGGGGEKPVNCQKCVIVRAGMHFFFYTDVNLKRRHKQRTVCHSGRRGHARKIRSTNAYACMIIYAPFTLLK